MLLQCFLLKNKIYIFWWHSSFFDITLFFTTVKDRRTVTIEWPSTNLRGKNKTYNSLWQVSSGYSDIRNGCDNSCWLSKINLPRSTHCIPFQAAAGRTSLTKRPFNKTTKLSDTSTHCCCSFAMESNVHLILEMWTGVFSALQSSTKNDSYVDSHFSKNCVRNATQQCGNPLQNTFPTFSARFYAACNLCSFSFVCFNCAAIQSRWYAICLSQIRVVVQVLENHPTLDLSGLTSGNFSLKTYVDKQSYFWYP